MLNSPNVSHFQAVRAKWETQTQKRETQSRQRLVSRSTTTANINTQAPQRSSTVEKLTTSTNKVNRLASLSMFNKSLTSLRSKGFSRGRQPSRDNEASESTMTLIGTHRDSFSPATPLTSLLTAPLTAVHASIPQPNAKPALVRSSTTSYLPVPTKVTNTMLSEVTSS
jgi:Ca2+-dependent lipid-binding protein